jgi:hypothetical protein
MEQRAQVSD